MNEVFHDEVHGIVTEAFWAGMACRSADTDSGDSHGSRDGLPCEFHGLPSRCVEVTVEVP